MQCSACGTKLPTGANACPNCGALSPAYHLYGGSTPNDVTQLSPKTPHPVALDKQPSGQESMQNQYGIPNYMQPARSNGQSVASSSSINYNTPSGGIGGTEENLNSQRTTDPYGDLGGTEENPNSQRTTNPYGDSGFSLYHTDTPPPPPPPVDTPPSKKSGKKRGLAILTGILIILLLIGLGAWILPTTRHPAKSGGQPTIALTASNAQTLYQQTTGTSPATSDPLSGPDNLGLDNYAGQGNSTRCFFSNNTYHSSATQGYFSPCYAKTTNYQNFVAEVTMKIISGHSGGLIFRADSTNDQGYQFRISTDGTYILNRIILDKQGNPIGDNETVTSGTSAFVNTGTGKSNQLSVLAQGNSMALFINGKYVTIATDPTYGSGQIGIYVDSDANTVEGAFSDLKIWKLS